MRLIKLLYIADRNSLRETGRSITGDRVVAMRRGPVLSRVLNLIKDQDIRSAEWRSFVETDGYHVRLVNDPGNGELCPYEIDTLHAVWEQYRSKDEWDMVEETHNFPEWAKNDPGLSSKPIPLSDILEAIGRSADIERIEREARQAASFDELFGS